jgi:antitoxin component of MazEF toxin-antitoxin module
MPLIQKLIQVGDSRAVTLPKTWLNYYERKTGKRIKEVTLEVNGKIIIQPLLSELTESEKLENVNVNTELKQGVFPK